MTVVPGAKEALNRFKMEAASEVGVNLKQGYNGDLTAKQAGSIGGQMVKKIKPVRTLNFERKCRIVKGHKTYVRYAFNLTVQSNLGLIIHIPKRVQNAIVECINKRQIIRKGRCFGSDLFRLYQGVNFFVYLCYNVLR